MLGLGLFAVLARAEVHDLSRSHAYAHDGLHRLVSYTEGVPDTQDPNTIPAPTRQQQWNLDKLGNWKTFTETLGGATITQDRSHNKVNELRSITTGPTTKTLKYDPAGNLKDDEVFHYRYDEEQRLKAVFTSVVDPITGNRIAGDPVARYKYDALGRRILKRLLNADGTTLSVTRFYYDGDRVVEERTGAQNLPTRQYIWGNYVDELLISDTVDALGNVVPAARLYALQNSTYSVHALVDDVGAVVERYDYTPYGEVSTRTGAGAALVSSAVGNVYTFTGRELDAETGLLHFRARTYAPKLGKFIQRDPSGFADGSNLYEYARSRPDIGRDPSGTLVLAENEAAAEKLAEWFRAAGLGDVRLWWTKPVMGIGNSFQVPADARLIVDTKSELPSDDAAWLLDAYNPAELRGSGRAGPMPERRSVRLFDIASAMGSRERHIFLGRGRTTPWEAVPVEPHFYEKWHMENVQPSSFGPKLNAQLGYFRHMMWIASREAPNGLAPEDVLWFASSPVQPVQVEYVQQYLTMREALEEWENALGVASLFRGLAGVNQAARQHHKNIAGSLNVITRLNQLSRSGLIRVARPIAQTLPALGGVRAPSSASVLETPASSARPRMLALPAAEPVVIEFPVGRGVLNSTQRQAFIQHLAEQEAQLNALTNALELELNLGSFPTLSQAVDRSRRLANLYLGPKPEPMYVGQRFDAAHKLDAVAGGRMHEFAGWRDARAQELIGSLWRARRAQIEPGRVHKLVAKFEE